jgi:GNAT superfamily N-acetyltransferase
MHEITWNHMGSTKIVIDGLTNIDKSDWDKSIACLTDAFTEDLCLKYLLESDVYDPLKAKHIHEYTLKSGCRFGHVFTTGKNVEGVSIWLPPNRQNVSSLMTAWMFIRSGGFNLSKLVNPTTVDIIRKYGDYSAELHHRSITKPHWYLMSIGVAPQYQGQGFARKLIVPMLNYFDQHSQNCFLETHNPRNVEIYLKYGFKVTETGILPGTDTVHWSMVRESE